MLKQWQKLLSAAQSKERVSDLTHTFYRYPARFSPVFARAAIELLTRPGDVVLDPFMGGGTTLVEAYSLGRTAIGMDINALSVFVSRVKVSPLQPRDFAQVKGWAERLDAAVRLNRPCPMVQGRQRNPYLRNMTSKDVWPIRKSLELAIAALAQLPLKRQREFVRCAILQTGQWALDCRYNIPSAAEFRQKLHNILENMLTGMKDFCLKVAANDKAHCKRPALCLHRSAAGSEKDEMVKRYGRPRLVLTSPPYPGVHVLYHRWQVRGRRETPAPFWIANCTDGHPGSFYTFGDRQQPSLGSYFAQLEATYKSIAGLMDRESLLVQMVAFSDPSWQQERYCEVMRRVGLKEVVLDSGPATSNIQLERAVPNRKWYAEQKGKTPSSRELVLLHRLA